MAWFLFFLSFFFLLLLFWDKASVRSLPRLASNHDPSASASQLLGSQVCITILAIEQFKYLNNTEGTGSSNLLCTTKRSTFQLQKRLLLLHTAETLDATRVRVGGRSRRSVSASGPVDGCKSLTRQDEGARFVSLQLNTAFVL